MRHRRSPAGVSLAGASESIEPAHGITIQLSTTAERIAKAGAGMEPTGAERHRRSPEGVSSRERANQSNRRARTKIPLSTKPERNLRRGRESNPRIAVLQTATLPLGYPAGFRERQYR